MSDQGRIQFSWPHPGELRELGATAFEQSLPEDSKAVPLATFCLAVLSKVTCVDYIHLQENRREIFSVTTNGSFQHTLVNP
jgi:hypothetical protein